MKKQIEPSAVSSMASLKQMLGEKAMKDTYQCIPNLSKLKNQIYSPGKR